MNSCSTGRGVGEVPLPLPREMVTDDVSLGGSVGAWGCGRGGWWEIKNARRRKIEDEKCRKHGDLVEGEVRW